jgi:site-specific recombinase XerD
MSLLDQGVDIPVIALLLGHEQVSTTWGIYIDPRELQQVQEKYLVTWPRL